MKSILPGVIIACAAIGCGGVTNVETDDDPCAPADVFVGWDGCYHPDTACCPLADAIDLDALCGVAGPRPAAILCAQQPGFLGGALTDYRACFAVQAPLVACSWGASTLLCCDP